MAGVISTPHTLATEAGMQMFRAGGNAVDAALAAAAVLTVVYPHQCALGGDAFARSLLLGPTRAGSWTPCFAGW